MVNPARMVRALAFPFLALGPVSAPAADPPAAQLVFPSDPLAAHAEIDAALRRHRGFTPSWPASAGTLCLGADSSLPALAEACREVLHPPTFRMTAHLGFHPAEIPGPLALPFETFDPGWGSVRVDPEIGREWARLPPALSFELSHAFSPRVFAHFRMGLRRDIAAWHADDLGLNLPLQSKAVDLNEPSLGYLAYEGDWLELVVGRFPVHWGPSREFGLALSDATPFHNAAQAVLKAPRLRYRFLVSSLNPWLEGTPPGDTSGTAYPVGSEEWRQRNYPVLPGSENAHRRVYDARSKTLIAHRLETWVGPVSLGVTETQIIGGKVPDLRDMNPFAVFHNDFHEGYANNNVSVDALLRLPGGFSVATEVFMDDLEWSATEGTGSSPSLLGYLGGVRHAFMAGGWAFAQSLHAVYTDPFLYGFLQPLNAYASRRVLSSNFQNADDPVFVDKFVVDHPIGYMRGADALDLWYRVEAWHGQRLGATAEVALLAKGESGYYAPYERYFEPHGSAPNGTPERELRFRVSGWARSPEGWTISAGAAFLSAFDRGHVEGADRSSVRLSAGLAQSFPR